MAAGQLGKPKVGIIIQARTSSTRLPGKVLRKVGNKTLFDQQLDRLEKTGILLIIATTDSPADNEIVKLAERRNIHCFRGDEQNVLKRFYKAALKYELDVIIRICADCPLIDPEIIVKGLQQYLAENNTRYYLTNGHKYYAIGFNFEIFSFDLLEEAYRHAIEPSDLEHVTPFIWKQKAPEIIVDHMHLDEDNSEFRLTVDTQADLDLVNTLVEKYHAETLNYQEIIQILKEHPEVCALNKDIQQKKV